MHLSYSRKNFYYFENLRIKRILSLIPNLKISEKQITDILYSDNRKIVIQDDKTLFLANLYFRNYILKIINFYKQMNINLIPIVQKYPFGFSCLSEDDHDGLKLHCDTTQIIDEIQRYIGCIVYLNDDYEGGEIVFPLLDLKLKPKPGSLITYRSDIQFPHYVKKVTKGKKWILQGYFRIRGENE